MIDKSPCYAGCLACDHAWVAAWLPMDVDQFAAVLKNVKCPRCAAKGKQIVMPSRGQIERAEARATPVAVPVVLLKDRDIPPNMLILANRPTEGWTLMTKSLALADPTVTHWCRVPLPLKGDP